ncbi:MAG TPA: diguanylate cyclase [Burkholderiales bacterium]|nr:diguanylate cyclase [Burkholderiales bacterium]
MGTRKRARAPDALTGDWSWEQDAELRFTRFDLAGGTSQEREHARRVIGKRCWECGVEVDGGWAAHRSLLEARRPFRDVLMWRELGDGRRRYVQVSGEPRFGPRGRFLGYRGVGRNVTEQRRGEELLHLQHGIARTLADAGALEGCVAVLRALCESEQWDCGELWRLDEQAQAMRRFAQWIAPGRSPAALAERLVSKVSQSAEPLWAPEPAGDCLLCPVPSGGRIVGVLAFAGRPHGPPEQALLEALVAVSTQLGLFLRRVEAEARLRESEAHFRQVVDSANEGILVYDRALNIYAANNAAAHILGVPREQLIGRPGFTSLLACVREDGTPLAPEDRPTRVTLRTGAPVTGMVLGLPRRDGGLAWIAVNTAFLRRPGESEPYGIVSTISEITARRRMELALRESEARFRSLTDLSSDWYWEQDAEHRFVRMEGRHVAGGDETLRRRLLGHRRWDTGLQIEGGWEAHRAALEARQPFHDALMWRTMADGSVRYLRVSGEPVFDREGRFTGYRGVGRDVTEQTRAEHLLRLEHRVASALAQAPGAAGGLAELLRLVGEAEEKHGGRYFAVEDGALVVRAAWRETEVALEPMKALAMAAWRAGEPLWSPDGALAFAAVAEGETLGVLALAGGSRTRASARLLQSLRVLGANAGQFLRRLQAEASLRRSESRFRALTEMSSDFFWETDPAHCFVAMVPGPGGATDPGHRPAEPAWPEVRPAMQARRPFRDVEVGRPGGQGTLRYLAVSGDPHFDEDGAFRGYRGVGRDITDSALARERIASLAFQDPLTGLDNRTSLAPALERAVERTRRRGSRLAGLFVDLDGFKQVNDRHGHDAGDRLLIEVARRLRAALRAGDPVARLGGDEFFVVLEDVGDATPAERVAGKLLASLRQPFELGAGVAAAISASIGISVYPDDAGDAATLMKHADHAMYAAKQAGRNAYRMFKAISAANDPRAEGERKA